MAVVKKKVTNEVKPEEKFTLGQLLAAKRFSNRKDLLKAVLSEGKKYSVSEAEGKIEEFMKGKVK